MKIFVPILALFIMLTSVSIANAHQPRLVKHETTIVNNPEVSQAFYAELTGDPHEYKIESDVQFNLYVGLLVPDIAGVEKDFSALITKEEQVHNTGDDNDIHEHDRFEVLLDGPSHKWTPYYEEHAGDDYFIGPALQTDDSDPAFHPKGIAVEAGEYSVEIFSPDNEGKYVLVVGDTEKFPLIEIANTVTRVPQVKEYFNKSPLSAFSTPTMAGFLAIIVLLAVVVVGSITFLIRKMKK